MASHTHANDDEDRDDTNTDLDGRADTDSDTARSSRVSDGELTRRSTAYVISIFPFIAIQTDVTCSAALPTMGLLQVTVSSTRSSWLRSTHSKIRPMNAFGIL